MADGNNVSALLVSGAALVWSAITWIKTDRDTKALAKTIYKEQQWSSLRQDICTRRWELEDELAKFDGESEELASVIDFAERISTSYRLLLVRHKLLSMALERAGRSIYVADSQKWLDLQYQPVFEGDTIVDRTGNLINDASAEAAGVVERRNALKSVVTEFHMMIRLIDEAIRIEDITHDPDKI